MVVLEQDDRVDAAPRQPPRDGRDGARNRALHVRRDLPAGTRLTLPTSRLCLSAFRSPRPARRPPPSVLRPSPLAPPASRLPTPASLLRHVASARPHANGTSAPGGRFAPAPANL